MGEHNLQTNGRGTATTNGINGHHTEDYDLICVGFGPASLAVAIALEDEQIRPAPRVLFIEKQTQFVWHAGMLLPGSRMQISFIKDLATLRNPRSEFTFLNYLHNKGRLVQFANLGTFLPLREEYNDYMSWCAQKFEDNVRYGEEVTAVEPIDDRKEPVRRFRVCSSINGSERTRTAKHVIIAVGGRPSIPKRLPQSHPRVLHSSKYASSVKNILPDSQGEYQIAVVGGGQSAAEIFSDLHNKYPNATVNLFIKSSALRPSDDSPFVNEVFNPDRVDDTYSMPDDMRKTAITQDRATNYGVVRLELLERLYDEMYVQRLHNEDESTWKLRIHPRQEIISASSHDHESKIEAKIQNLRSGDIQKDAQIFDLVMVATGYERNMHEHMLSAAKWMMSEENRTKTLVNRDYSVEFDEGRVSKDAGIWLQGCNESTHGLSDTLLSILSVRAGELVTSIFGTRRNNMMTEAKKNLNGFGQMNGEKASKTQYVNGHTNSNGIPNDH